MINIGNTNKLVIARKVGFGLYLEHPEDSSQEVLLPKRYQPKNYNIGDEIEVFVYLDSEDRIIATTIEPLAEVGEAAFLKVVDTSSFGAFLDWGMPKNLLAPFREQRIPMQKNKSYCVFIFIDNSGRICASSKLNRFLSETNNDIFAIDEKVDLQIASRSELGYKAIINKTHLGLIHNSDLLQSINIGSKHIGYIRKIRNDGRIDLSLQERGEDFIINLADKIFQYIKTNGGESDINEKSSPEEIFAKFKVSKTNFKKAITALYQDKRITIENQKIKIIS